MQSLENCLKDVNKWMGSNRLKMNNTKTEFVIFGSKAQLEKCKITEIEVYGARVERSPVVKYLGTLLDENLNLKKHITKKCQIAMINIIRIRNIRHYLTVDACKIVMSGLVLSHLDYCNGLFTNLPEASLKKLQRVQNIAAKITLQKKRQ